MRRGQVSIFALIGTLLAVLVIVALMLRWGQVERGARSRAVEGAGASGDARALAIAVEGALRDSVEEAVYELGRHGGYTADALPGPSVHQRPVLAMGGRVTGLPTLKAMEALLARDASRRLARRLDDIRARSNGTVSFGAPSVSVSLREESVEARLALVYGAAGDGAAARAVEPVTVALDLRLRTLWSAARAYLEGYARERRPELALLSGIMNDARIPAPPGGVRDTIPCEGRTLLASRADLAGPFADNARLATAQEAQQVRRNATNDIEWSLAPETGLVNITLLANARTPAESDERVELLALPVPFADLRSGSEPLCLGRYNVSYTARFPMGVTLRDLRPVARGARSQGAPLEFSFVVEPYLRGTDHKAGFDAGVPAEVDDPCSPGGSGCALELDVTGPGDAPVDGAAWLGPCALPFEGGRLARTPVPCGEQTLAVEASRPPGLAAHVERVELDGVLSRRVRLGERGVVRGRVFLRDRVWCQSSRRVREPGEVALGFVDGVPPRAVDVHLVPLDGALGPTLSTVADEEARFSFPPANPGTYLLLAVSTTDSAGHPSYKVRARGIVAEVAPGDNGMDVEMFPLVPVLTPSGYEYVTGVGDC